MKHTRLLALLVASGAILGAALVIPAPSQAFVSAIVHEWAWAEGEMPGGRSATVVASLSSYSVSVRDAEGQVVCSDGANLVSGRSGAFASDGLTTASLTAVGRCGVTAAQWVASGQPDATVTPPSPYLESDCSTIPKYVHVRGGLTSDTEATAHIVIGGELVTVTAAGLANTTAVVGSRVPGSWCP